MSKITFNDKLYSFTPGTSVLDAAKENNVRIPTLCHHPALKSVGACRLCMVEIDGMRGTPTACTTPAVDGMIVRTNTPNLLDLRREILGLILSEHPYTCLMCERNERCTEWQVTIRKAAVTTGCENCPKNGQCELQTLVDEIGLGEMRYPISYRGLTVEKDDPFFDRDYNLCILCGRCVRVCQDVRQTGTLAFINRGAHTVVGTAFGQSHLLTDCEFCGSCVDVCPTGALYDKRTKWEGTPEKMVATVCPYCSVGCEMDLWVKGDKVMGVRPTQDGAVNQGMACARGRFGIVEMIHAPDRLRTPLVRKNGRLIEIGWDEALGTAAQVLDTYRGSAFALLASPHLTNEAAQALNTFARQTMGSSYVDVPTTLPRIPRVAELSELLRSERSASIRTIRDARLVIAIGTNPCISHPVAALYIRQAQANGAKLIVLDPRRTELARRADEWIQVEPGKDTIAIQSLKSKTAGQQSMIILYGSGVTHHPDAPDTIRAIHELAGLSQANVIPLLGAANTLGVLACGLAVSTPDCSYEAIVDGILSRRIKALYVTGELPPLDALANLELLIVQDQFLSPHAAEFAKVVFPAASFAEITGTFTNLEGRTQELSPAISPIGDSRPDVWIVSQLVSALGSGTIPEAGGITNQALRVATHSFIPSPTYPFTLILERNTFSYRSSALTDRVRGMELYKSDEEVVAINPEDAARLGIAQDELVKISSEYGSATFLAHLSADISPGLLFASINSAHGSLLFPAMLPATKAYVVNAEKAQ